MKILEQFYPAKAGQVFFFKNILENVSRNYNIAHAATLCYQCDYRYFILLMTPR
jgi:hypothetical protein